MTALVFTCPNCGDPSAMTVEDSVDIHAGATYTCDECGGKVVFEAFTIAEYCAYGNRNAEAKGNQ